MTALPAGSSAWAMYRALVGIGCFCALLIVSVYLLTQPVIAQKRADAMHRAVFDVLPGTARAIALQRDGQSLLRRAKSEQTSRLYLGLDAQNRITGVALAAEGMGYQDVITLLYGYAPDRGEIVGMQVLNSRETPGLGSRIGDDPDFLSAFAALPVPLTDDGQQIRHPLALAAAGRDKQPWQIDAISGATVSSQAVAAIIAASSAQWVPLIAQQHDALQRMAQDE